MALIGSLTSGVSALDAFSEGMDVIGNNIANVDTTGFKTSAVNYADGFSDLLQAPTPAPASGIGSGTDTIQVGEGVNVQSVSQNFTQGSLNATGTPTDMAISGNGFFVVQDPSNQENYATRAGNFTEDANGYLTTSGGMRVQGLTGGTPSFTATVVNGQLSYSLDSSTPPTTVGSIQLTSNASVAAGTITNSTGGAFTDAQVDAGAPQVTGFAVDGTGNISLELSNGSDFNVGGVLLQNFQNPNALVSVAGNLYTGLSAAQPIGGSALTAANNTPGQSGTGQITQGSLELSNVDLSTEMANLITTQRSFEAGSRIITTSDTLLGDVIALKQ
jgi:flagellar hook protein FlgE